MENTQEVTITQLSKSELLGKLYSECGLVKEDSFTHQHYTILTRSGIEKIEYAKKISVSYEIVHCEPTFCVIKATGSMGDEVIETFGSASPATSHNKYYPEMAEKRALSRVVLKLTKAYSMGVFGEEEADAFKNSKPAVAQ
jgi:hypothetical protein